MLMLYNGLYTKQTTKRVYIMNAKYFDRNDFNSCLICYKIANKIYKGKQQKDLFDEWYEKMFNVIAESLEKLTKFNLTLEQLDEIRNYYFSDNEKLIDYLNDIILYEMVIDEVILTFERLEMMKIK